MTHLTHLSPLDAVTAARRQDDPGQTAEHLDRYLRARLLDFLQNREGERGELSKALVGARNWAVRQKLDYRDRWSLLLEVLEDSRSVPAKVEQLDLLTDRETSILAQLVISSEKTSGARPKDLAKTLKTSEQNVNNYLRRMQKAGLVVRHRMPGQRAVLVFPTRKAIRLAEQLQAGQQIVDSPSSEHSAPEVVIPNQAPAPALTLWLH